MIRHHRAHHDHPHHERVFAFGAWRPPFEPRGFGRGRGRGRGRGANVRGAVLALLAERPMHGYEMIQEIERRSGGAWRPSPGSVYPTLQLLEDEGLIESEAAEGGRRRFTLTEQGRAEQAASDARAPWEQIGEDVGSTIVDMRTAVHGIMQAMVEVHRVGTDEQRERAREVLAETRRKLYAILAEES